MSKTGRTPVGVEDNLGYGYRSMSQDELKGYTMEVDFDSVGCNLTLFAGDAWHYTKYKLTYQELTEWQNSGRYAAYLAWTRSEFVRQFLEDPDRADSMPYSGVAKWAHGSGRQFDRSAKAFTSFLSKWQVS